MEFIAQAVGVSLFCAAMFQFAPKLLALVFELVWRVLVFVKLAGAITDRSIEEFHQGYSTLQLSFGLPGHHANRRWEGSGHRTPWDYSGLWTLDGPGKRILAEPNRLIDPPGLYPSPNRPGSFELWTGVAWSGRYRKA